MRAAKYLFPVHVLHAMNAIQYLRAIYIMTEPFQTQIYSSHHEIADAIGAPRDSIIRTMPVLHRMGLVKVRGGAAGGYMIIPHTLSKVQVVDILEALGPTVPVNDTSRGSDRLNHAVSKCLSVALEEFLR